jgi:hypothetical protein
MGEEHLRAHEIKEPRISANLRESHFSCAVVLCSGLSPTQESHAVWKNAVGKTRVRVFLFVTLSFYVIEK